MYKVYCDGLLLYEPPVEELQLIAANMKLEINKAGTFTFSIQEAHPLYGSIRKLKSVIEVYQDNAMLFRGRPVNDGVDTFNVITFLCEGDMAMLNDSLVRPYSFQGTITGYLQKLITDHNTQVEASKQFTLGTVTVTDPNDYIVRSNQNYPSTWTEIENKLIDLLGGYIRVRRSGGINYIDYLEDSTFMSNQVISLGENLIEANRERRSEDIATAIIPIGAEMENEDGSTYRVDITSVNAGVDYIYNQDAVDVYGWIFKNVVFDDVTVPSNLLSKANQALAKSILLLNTIELTAVDLSMMDVDIDEFRVFEYVRVTSPIHQLDDLYLIRKLTVDLLNPAGNTITVGTQYSSFTEKQYQTVKVIENVTREVGENAEQYATTLVNNAKIEMNNSILQEAGSLRTEVSETYTSKTELEAYKQEVGTEFSQTKNTFDFQFTQMTQTINSNQELTDTEFELIRKYIRFEDGNIILGELGNEITLKLENDILGFYQSGNRVAYLSDNKLYVTDGEFINSLKLGNFAFTPRNNGNLSFGRVV